MPVLLRSALLPQQKSQRNPDNQRPHGGNRSPAFPDTQPVAFPFTGHKTAVSLPSLKLMMFFPGLLQKSGPDKFPIHPFMLVALGHPPLQLFPLFVREHADYRLLYQNRYLKRIICHLFAFCFL
jgi:hypothetical protein